MRSTLESQNGDYDLTSKVQVFNYTMPASAGPSLCYARLVFGDGAKDLDGTGGTFELYVEVNGVPREPYPQEVEFSTETVTGIDVEPFVAEDSEDIDIYVKSPNAGDSDVDVTVKLYDISPFQSLTRGRDGLVDADGKMTLPDTQKVDLNSILGTALTEGGAGRLSAALKKLLDVAVPANTLNDLALEATLTGMKGDTFNPATDSLEALRDRGDAAWITASGFSTLDAAGVRTALGLAAANLDTQLLALLVRMEADIEIDVETTPFELVAKTKGTENELLRQKLYQLDGSPVTSADHLVAHKEAVT